MNRFPTRNPRITGYNRVGTMTNVADIHWRVTGGDAPLAHIHLGSATITSDDPDFLRRLARAVTATARDLELTQADAASREGR